MGLLSPRAVVVFDAIGDVFNSVRAADLGMAIWRVTNRRRMLETTGIDLAIVASYDSPDWVSIAELAALMPTVIVAAKGRYDDARQALGWGAFGYIEASLAQPAMRRALLGALNGEPAYSRRVFGDRLRAHNGNGRTTRATVLTPRQREVVALIAKGAADKEIAQALGITTATAQKHVTNLLKRLNVPNRAAAVAAAAVYPHF